MPKLKVLSYWKALSAEEHPLLGVVTVVVISSGVKSGWKRLIRVFTKLRRLLYDNELYT